MRLLEVCTSPRRCWHLPRCPNDTAHWDEYDAYPCPETKDSYVNLTVFHATSSALVNGIEHVGADIQGEGDNGYPEVTPEPTRLRVAAQAAGTLDWECAAA